MLFQSLLIGLLFLGALTYLARVVWQSFRPAPNGAGCAKGCGTCEAASAVNRRLSEVKIPASR